MHETIEWKDLHMAHNIKELKENVTKKFDCIKLKKHLQEKGSKK